jgi:hypothetical protein
MDCELFLKVLRFFAIQLGANIVVYFFVTSLKKSCDNFIVIFFFCMHRVKIFVVNIRKVRAKAI